MKKLFVFFATLFICISLFAEKSKLSVSVNKKNGEVVTSAEKVVKVGYIITTGDNFMVGADIDEAKDGYAYEYLRTVASYTGWKYEYVEVEDSTAKPVFNLLKAKRAFCARYMPDILPKETTKTKASDDLLNW